MKIYVRRYDIRGGVEFNIKKEEGCARNTSCIRTYKNRRFNVHAKKS